jgi:NAD(P)-dependent dehydrogenase (short-subunit alcohol dehydrogenase family)
MGILDSFRLDGRTALVTGGTKGLGRAMASALAEVGANVVVCSRNGDEAATVAAEIAGEHGGKTAGYEADVTHRDSVTILVAKCAETFGGIDILINNAGINVRKPTAQLTEEDWDSVMDISVKGSFLCSQAAMPGMMERGWGRIVMMGSIMSFVSIPGRAAYAASKTALLGLTRTLALEGAARGVTVNCICPGPFDTPMNRPLLEDPVAFQAFLSKIPVGRWGDPVELGGAVVYLCSPAAAFMTGTSLVIDGGWTIQ